MSSETAELNLTREGFAVVASVIDGGRRELLAGQVGAQILTGAGSRHLLDEPWCRALAVELRVNDGLRDALGGAVAVQCTLFDKSPQKNWLVALHQDLSIPVKARVYDQALSGWSEKDGRHFVQPPVEVLEQLVAVRVHIDDCPEESGPLRVVPGSHAFGRLDGLKIEALRAERGEMSVPVARGGALVMRPLILHASSKASAPQPRRVLHFVFGPARLPFGLEWRWAV